MSDELNALAGAYALDSLDADEKAIFEDHLQGCRDCAEEVRGMQNAAAELSHLEATTPPPQLRSDVLETISRVRPLAPLNNNVVSISRARPSRWALQFVAAACALFAIVATGWGYQQHQDANRARTTASGLTSAIAGSDSKAVSGTLGAGSKASAQIYYSKAADSLVMSAHGIATLAADKTYQAWLIAPDGKATSLGTFHPDAHGNVIMQGHADLADAASVGVSIEPAGGSKSPTGRAATVNL